MMLRSVVITFLVCYISHLQSRISASPLWDKDICDDVYLAISSGKTDGIETPSPIDINTCTNQVQDDSARCTFNTSSCKECLLGYESDQRGCPLSCTCQTSGFLEEDIKFDEKDLAVIKQVYEAPPDGVEEAASVGLKRWDNIRVDGRVRVPYVIDAQISDKARTAIEGAIEAYKNETCIELVPRQNEYDYIDFVSKGGCWSFIGRRGGAQEISIGFGCEWNGVVQHELMHALGFWHEQSRPDRDQYVVVVTENIAVGKEHNFNKRSSIDSLGSPYDLKSLMHYGGYSFSSNFQPTILVKATNKPVQSQRLAFSEEDRAQINAIYQCFETPATIEPSTQEPAWSSWESWSDCPVTCGSGTQTRDRQCLSGGSQSAGCEGSSSEERTCDMGPCVVTTTVAPSVGYWSSWREWMPCSRSCNIGYQWRYRRCIGNGGCVGSPWSGRVCNTQSCEMKPDVSIFTGDAWDSSFWLCRYGELHTGDFNGDGKGDLLCHYYDNWVRISYGSISGEYSTIDWEGRTILCRTFSQSRSITVGDFNGDGKDDLLCHEEGTGKMRALMYTEDTKFNSKSLDWEGSFPGFCSDDSDVLYSEDVNGDELSDLLCKTQAGYLSVMLNRYK